MLVLLCSDQSMWRSLLAASAARATGAVDIAATHRSAMHAAIQRAEWFFMGFSNRVVTYAETLCA